MFSAAVTTHLTDFTLDIAFEIHREVLVLFGPSGCGKTTTLRSIAGLIRPASGRIVLDGHIFFDSERHVFVPPRERQIGYMFQDFALFPHMNVRKNIWYGVKQRDTRTEDMFAQLTGTLKIAELVDRHVESLSGGEKQRVALARALMAEPKLLLLDEPMSSLDLDTRLELQAELMSMQKLWNIPFILVTHDPDEARAMGTRILFLDKGKQAVRDTF